MSSMTEADLKVGQQWWHHRNGPATVAALGAYAGRAGKHVTVRWELRDRPDLIGTFSEYRTYPLPDFLEAFDPGGPA